MAGPTPVIRFLVPRQTQTDSSSNTSSGSWLDGLWYLLIIVGVGVIVIIGAVYGGYRLWLSCYKVRHKKSLSSDSTRDLLISELRNSTSKDTKANGLSEASHSTAPTSAGLHDHNVVVSGANISPAIEISPPSHVPRDPSRPLTPAPSGVTSGLSSPAHSQTSVSSSRSPLSSPATHVVYIEPQVPSSLAHPLHEPSYPPRPFQRPGPENITPFQIPSPQVRSDLELGLATRVQDFTLRHHVNIDAPENPSNWYPGGVLTARTEEHTRNRPSGNEEMPTSHGIHSSDLVQGTRQQQQQQPWFERTADPVRLLQRKKQLPGSSHDRNGVSLAENLEPEHRSLYSALSRNPSTSTSTPTVLQPPPPPPPPYTPRDMPTEPKKTKPSPGPLFAAEGPSPRSSTSALPPRYGGPRGPRTSPLNGGMRSLHPSEAHEQHAIDIDHESAVPSTHAQSYLLSGEDVPPTLTGAHFRAGDSSSLLVNVRAPHPGNGQRRVSRAAEITSYTPQARGSFDIGE